MKLEVNDGVVTVSSETKTEATQLFTQFFEASFTGVVEVKVKEPKKHKKHEFKKPCDICGKMFKGNRAIAIHKFYTHKVKSENYEKNKKYQADFKERKAQRELMPVKNIFGL
jgi:hypothetical protein